MAREKGWEMGVRANFRPWTHPPCETEFRSKVRPQTEFGNEVGILPVRRKQFDSSRKIPAV